MLAGLIPSVSVYPGLTLPTGLVGLTLVAPFILWGRMNLRLPHFFLGLFFFYVLTSALWSPGHQLWGIWQWACFALGIIATMTLNLRHIWIGLALGLTISSTVAAVQYFGFNFLNPLEYSHPTGLYLNPSLHGWVLALGIIGLVCMRMWVLALPLLPGLVLSHSRGAIVVTAFGLLATVVRKPLVLLALLTYVFAVITVNPSSNDIQRIEIWRHALNLSDLIGNGVGSFQELYYHDARTIWHAQFAHNDYIQLIFEYGLGAIPLLGTLLWVGLDKENDMWPLHISCSAMALFSFPLYTPMTAFIWALAIGAVIKGNTNGHSRGH